jgi:hypothetical protein
MRNYLISLCETNAVYYSSNKVPSLNELFSEKYLEALDNNPTLVAFAKLLIDISEISYVIDKSLLKKEYNILSLKDKQLSLSIRKLSNISDKEVLKSRLYKEFIDYYSNCNPQSNVKDSVIGLPSFPYYIDNTIFTNNKFNNIVLQKTKYENSKITTTKFWNKYSFLKGEYKHVVISDNKL